MMDLIDRQTAIELIKNYCENGCDIAEENWCPSCQQEQFIELLKDLPSVQPEVLAHGVVKCRECKYSAMIYSTNMVPVVGGFEVEGICHIFCQCDKFGGIEMRWDDFCSYAERKEK